MPARKVKALLEYHWFMSLNVLTTAERKLYNNIERYLTFNKPCYTNTNQPKFCHKL